MQPVKRIFKNSLERFVQELFMASGLPAVDAELVARMLVLQEMRGVVTHGLRRVFSNLEGLSNKQMNPRPNRAVLCDERATVLLDGDHGVGTLGCMDAMERAITKAGQFGIGIGIVINNNHFQSAAPYCLRAIEAGMISICFSNTWASMGYPGTNIRAIANSPLGFGVPTGAEFPIVFDSALTTSGGKLDQWIREGKSIPAALLGIDKHGNPSADPAAVLGGGVPWPIGDYKGAGLAILVEVLTGVLGGGGFLYGIQPPDLRASKENAESQCCIAIQIACFMPMEKFCQRMNQFINDLKSNPTAPGHAEILLPGERAQRKLEESLRDGVFVETEVRAELQTWATRLGVISPF